MVNGSEPDEDFAALFEASVQAARYERGQTVEGTIVAIGPEDPSSRRIRLSRKAVLAAQEAQELREYAERTEAAPAEGFGSLGHKLRGALGPRET